MDEHRVERHEQEVRVERGLREAEQEHRHHHQAARDDDVEHVQARARQPVEGAARVVDRVEAPEPGHRVKGAVHPVLGEVGDHEDLERLQRERLPLDRSPQRLRLPHGRERGRRQQRHEGERLDRQVAHHEVGAVGGPAEPEGRLLRQAREGALERHEHQREQEQVQQEPVEPERERLVEPALDRHAAAAGERGGEREADPGEPQDLAPAQDERDGAEQEREADRDLEQRAQQRYRVVGPERRRGERAREPERHDAEEGQRAQEHAGGARHPARAEVRPFGVAEDALEPALERRGARGRRVIRGRRRGRHPTTGHLDSMARPARAICWRARASTRSKRARSSSVVRRPSSSTTRPSIRTVRTLAPVAA